MADLDPGPVGEHLNWVLRWWVVIVAVFSLGAAGVRKGVVAPRKELDRLGDEVADLRQDMGDNCSRLERLEAKVDKLADLILRLHTAHGLAREEDGS